MLRFYRDAVTLFYAVLLFIPDSVIAQSGSDLQLPVPKRLIDKVEIFSGPNLSFNHGNMFVENYRGQYANNNVVTNKRKLKSGYLLGIGVYHPLAKRIDLNLRIQYEQKGTKNILNNPLNPVNDATRQISTDNYTYNYITISASPVVYLGNKKNWMVSLGAYYSKIKRVKGTSEVYNTRDNQVDKGTFEGRSFYHLREDGGIDGFTWMPYLNSIEAGDWGLTSSIGYQLLFQEKHSLGIQLQDNFGLININRNNPYNLKEQNHSLSILISYRYHFNPKPVRI